ncbi:MAG: hypothetical protein QOK29_4989 [Rhodospirillaceae bacterium]|nr:hypothetical protein [Rhodospirillaceae bacterium]
MLHGGMAHRTPEGRGQWRFRQWLPLLAIAIGIGLFFAFGLQRYLSFDMLRANRAWLLQQVAAHRVLVLAIYIALYAAAVALSLPGAVVLTLAGGLLFGQWLGTVATVLAATVGATLLFLAARTALAALLQSSARPWLGRMQQGFQANAFSYLLFLRLVPLFPFFIVNLVPAFLGVPLRVFIIATLIGIIPGTFVFTTVGAGLGGLLDRQVEPSISGILTPQILTALIGLALLALLPVAYRKWRQRTEPKP